MWRPDDDENATMGGGCLVERTLFRRYCGRVVCQVSCSDEPMGYWRAKSSSTIARRQTSLNCERARDSFPVKRPAVAFRASFLECPPRCARDIVDGVFARWGDDDDQSAYGMHCLYELPPLGHHTPRLCFLVKRLLRWPDSYYTHNTTAVHNYQCFLYGCNDTGGGFSAFTV